MEIGDLTESERRSIEAQVAGSGGGKSLETLLTEASQTLSGLTRSAGVVLSTKMNQRLKHIEFVRLEPERALAVLVAEDGQVENACSTCRPACRRRRWLKRRISSTRTSAARRLPICDRDRELAGQRAGWSSIS